MGYPNSGWSTQNLFEHRDTSFKMAQTAAVVVSCDAISTKVIADYQQVAKAKTTEIEKEESERWNLRRCQGRLTGDQGSRKMPPQSLLAKVTHQRVTSWSCGVGLLRAKWKQNWNSPVSSDVSDSHWALISLPTEEERKKKIQTVEKWKFYTWLKTLESRTCIFITEASALHP